MPFKLEEKRWVGEDETYVLISLNPIKDEKGKVIGCMGITHDITPIKKQEEFLREHNTTLQKIAEKLSHDFTEPILKINSMLNGTDLSGLTQEQTTGFYALKELTNQLEVRLKELKNDLVNLI
jgi:DUF438 domain-containing protein